MACHQRIGRISERYGSEALPKVVEKPLHSKTRAMSCRPSNLGDSPAVASDIPQHVLRTLVSNNHCLALAVRRWWLSSRPPLGGEAREWLVAMQAGHLECGTRRGARAPETSRCPIWAGCPRRPWRRRPDTDLRQHCSQARLKRLPLPDRGSAGLHQCFFCCCSPVCARDWKWPPSAPRRAPSPRPARDERQGRHHCCELMYSVNMQHAELCGSLGCSAAAATAATLPCCSPHVCGPRRGLACCFVQAFSGSSRSARRQARRQRQCTAMEESAVSRGGASMDELKVRPRLHLIWLGS